MKRFVQTATAMVLAGLLTASALGAPPAPTQSPKQAPTQAPAKAVQAPTQSPVQKGATTAMADSGYRSYSYQPAGSYSGRPSRYDTMWGSGFKSAGWKITGR